MFFVELDRLKTYHQSITNESIDGIVPTMNKQLDNMNKTKNKNLHMRADRIYGSMNQQKSKSCFKA